MKESKTKLPPKNNNNAQTPKPAPKEQGGPKGPEPTRYGDWEKGGKCVDF